VPEKGVERISGHSDDAGQHGKDYLSPAEIHRRYYLFPETEAHCIVRTDIITGETGNTFCISPFILAFRKGTPGTGRLTNPA